MVTQEKMDELIQSLVKVTEGLALLIKELQEKETAEDLRDTEYLDKLNELTSNLQGLVAAAIPPTTIHIPIERESESIDLVFESQQYVEV